MTHARRSPPSQTGLGPVLLTTKLNPPAARVNVVPRPELLATLTERSDRRLTLVGAPPGFGKTTLLAQWFDNAPGDHRFAWLSLDAADNDPLRFWTYVVASLRRVEAAIDDNVLEQFRLPGVDPSEIALPTLINALAEVDGPIVLIVDDVHLLTNVEILAGLSFLVESIPPTLHLALSARSDPPLPLSRLRARGELCEIRAADLRFTDQEALALVNDRLAVGLSPDDVAVLQRRTEGWAAGLYLAALSLQGRADTHGFVAAFAGDDRHIVDYLGAEVLDRQPPHVQRFLLYTSVLDRLSAPLCDAVTQTTGSSALLTTLERSNLFVVPLDQRREWYRYHRLFRQLLRHELDLREPGAGQELNRRASAWHAERGEIHEAIDHSLAADDAVEATRLIAENWLAYFNEGRLATVASWLDALPSEVVLGNPRLCVARAWIATDLGQVDDAGAWIDAASAHAGLGPDSSTVDAAIAVLQVVHRFKIGALADASAAARRALELEPAETPFERNVARILLGVTAFWEGDHDAAVDALDEGVRLSRRTGNKLGAVYALGYLTLAESERGNPESAARAASAATELIDDPARAEHFVAAMAHLARERVLEVAGDLAGAETAAARAVELSRRGAGLPEIAYALVVHASALEALGDRLAAQRELEQARGILDQCRDSGPRARLFPGRAVVSPPALERVQLREPLSERELAVLRLFPTDLSLREIGRELYISLNTVKTHTRHIFGKLAVSNRAEAVARARELGLL